MGVENNGYQPPKAMEPEEAIEESQLALDIHQRASTASEKIKKRVDIILLNINLLGDGFLNDVQNDFYQLEQNPNDPIGAGQYTGWSPDEIRELYQVLYDEELD